MSLEKRVDRVFLATKLMFVVYAFCAITICFLAIRAIVGVAEYVQTECQGNVSYCAGKVFSESKANFNKGVEEGTK